MPGFLLFYFTCFHHAHVTNVIPVMREPVFHPTKGFNGEALAEKEGKRFSKGKLVEE